MKFQLENDLKKGFSGKGGKFSLWPLTDWTDWNYGFLSLAIYEKLEIIFENKLGDYPVGLINK